MSEDNQTEQHNTPILLHLMVVGFHHKKGCLVEFCYPPLEENLFQSENFDKSTPTTGTPSPALEHFKNETEKITVNDEISVGSKKATCFTKVALPPQWRALPSLAIPDGAHNFDSDTVFFHLPQLEDTTRTVYCVACYRQMATKELLVLTDDITRSSVQKSVVAILRLPFYGLVEYKLEIVTKVYFNQRDFSQIQVLQDSFHNINRQLNPSIINSPELLTGLSVRALFNRFGSQVIVLFKLLLLEKKTIFISSPIRDLSASILTLCSLIPGLIQEGLEHSSIPFDVKSNSENKLLTRILSNEKLNCTSDNVSIKEDDTTLTCDIIPEIKNANNVSESDFITTVNAPDEHKVPIQTASLTKNESQCSLASLEPVTELPPFTEESEEETKKRFDTIINRPFAYYGLPLQLFTCSSYLLPYFSMPYFDILVNERVRSCMAGSSNQIFKRWQNDIDVFVVDNQVEIEDVQLKRILKPTVEDMNFMSFIIKAIIDNHNLSDETDIFDESQHIFYEGSDEWIRCHFKNYLLHLLTCSLLEDSSREYRAFNALFMAAWKTTHNYKAWSSGSYADLCVRDIDQSHPFTGNRLSNIRFKITNLLSFNRPELINQQLNKQSQAISNAINNARSTVNSWFTNLGTSLQQKATTSSWNAYLNTGNVFSAGKSIDNDKQNKQSNPKLKAEYEKESFVFYPGNGDDNPDEDETSV